MIHLIHVVFFINHIRDVVATIQIFTTSEDNLACLIPYESHVDWFGYLGSPSILGRIVALSILDYLEWVFLLVTVLHFQDMSRMH